MATNDPAEWRLYDTDLTTQLAILPFESSNILIRNNEPGSGNVIIPLDASIASSVTFGQFCQLYYRGSARVGFFVDTINQVDADISENVGRRLSMSGPGAMALLSRSVVQTTDGLATTRTFTSVTKASILKTLIDEAQARGELSQLAYDFTASVDSAAIAWTDSEEYKIEVGKNLLEVAQQFAETGEFDFKITFSAGTFTLSAYSAGNGSVKTSTIYLRIGTNCEEVKQDKRGEDIYNVYYVKWKNGYITVSDATSISTYGRRVKYLSLEQAQSSASATTYASAQLALTKDPKNNKTVKVYDGIAPRLWEDYDLGDTVSLDRIGTVSSDRILGIQADFDGSQFTHVTLDFNVIHYDDDLRMRSELDNLANQWATAHDGDLLEVSQGMSIGGTNGAVNAIHTYGDYVYVGGLFTNLSGLATNYAARYQISTHTWAALTGLSAGVIKMVDVSGTIYCCTADFKVWSLSGTTWTLIGTANASLRCMASDGTSLYVGGSLTLMDAVTINGKVAKRTAGVWSDMEPNPIAYYAESMEYFNGAIHVGFGGSPSSSLKYMSGGSYTNALNLSGKYVLGLKKVGSYLIIASNDNAGNTATTCTLYSWDGVSDGPGLGSATTIGTISDFLPVATSIGNGSCAISNYLTDVYFGADFDTIDSVAGFAGIAKYSGGLWSPVGGGVSTASGDGVTAIETVNTDVYAGGIFTTAFGIPTIDLSLFVTDFQSMLDHALNDYGGIDHERLSGLLGGSASQHYHLTSAEYTGTGSNEFVRKTSPTLVTPVLGVATATSINKVAITAPATSATLTIANGKTLTVSNTLTLVGTDSTTMTFPGASDTLAGLGTVQTFSAAQRFDGGVGVGAAASSTANINSDYRPTTTSGSEVSVNALMFGSPASASSANYIGSQITARSSSGNGNNFTGVLTGGLYNVIHQGTATMNDARAVSAQVLVNNSGTLTNGIAVDVLAPSISGGGAITNLYGVYVNAISGGATLNYAIYTNGGLVHFGDTVDLASGKNLTLLAGNITTDTTTGTKIGTATSQKFSFWNKTPIVQPTTGITGATFTAKSGTAVNDASTFGGYTIKQIAAALVNVGILA